MSSVRRQYSAVSSAVPVATGPAVPPIRTELGWLTTTIHAVIMHDETMEFPTWHFNWRKQYVAALMLLDLDEPRRVIAMTREPFLVPEAPYELEGFRGSVIFTGGLILEESGEVKIYYGGADTVECTAQLEDLLELCELLTSPLRL